MYTRREFISLASRAVLGLASGPFTQGLASVPSLDPKDEELISWPLRHLIRGLRSKAFSAAELVGAYLNRIEQINPWLNAIVTLTAEQAMRDAREADFLLSIGKVTGPLHGIPMTIKDSLDTREVVTTWGVPARAGFVPSKDSTVVKRLRSAGAILLGKTNTPELTLSFETNSPVHGATNNPYDIQCTAGGSSGGAAAIVAAAGSPFDIGSDTGGSIRLPAHFCGVAGIRPTSGLVPRTGNAVPPGGLLSKLTAIGPIARSVDDLELLLGIISGPDGADSSVVPRDRIESQNLRLEGLHGTFHIDNGICTPSEASASIVRKTTQSLTDAGLVFEHRRPPGIEETLELFFSLLNRDAGALRRTLLARARAAKGHDLELAGNRTELSAKDKKLLQRWDQFRARMTAFMAPFDLLICPVNAFPALPHGQVADHLDAFSYTMTYSLTDWPAATVRVGTSPEGLPVGVQIVAPPWREDIVLAAARHVEHQFGGWRRPEL